MRLGTRLALLLVAALLLPFGLFLWWVEGELEQTLIERTNEDLIERARLAAEGVGSGIFSDSLADRLGRAGGVRVTLIAPDGRVRGDSEVPPERIAGLENHGQRPEVRSALADGPATSRRVSRTRGLEYLYAAVPHPAGVVRVAVPASRADAPLTRTRRALPLAALVGLLLLLLAARPLARFVAGPLRPIRRVARAVAEGDASRRIRSDEGGPVGELARAVDEMADSLLEEATELRRENADLHALFETLEDGLAVVDREGRVVRANPSFRAWTGRDEVTGRRIATLFRVPEIVEAVEEGLAADGPQSREVELRNRWLLASAAPYGDGAVLVLRDLTALRRLEGVRRDFVANVSHELKTPLTTVLGFAEALGHEELPDEERERFAERLAANARRMKELVDDLLELSRLESGGREPRLETVSVSSAAGEAWRSLEPRAVESDIGLEVDTDEGDRVRADPEAVRRILRNLLDNALRYAPQGSVVTVASRPEGSGVRIAVIDRGPGIPSAERERIFERFYRVDDARSRAEGGTGLGLAIVKHLVRAHGGRVGVESEVGEGTTVWFTLPATEA